VVHNILGSVDILGAVLGTFWARFWALLLALWGGLFGQTLGGVLGADFGRLGIQAEAGDEQSWNTCYWQVG